MSYNNLDYDDDDMSWKDFLKALALVMTFCAAAFTGTALILYILFG